MNTPHSSYRFLSRICARILPLTTAMAIAMATALSQVACSSWLPEAHKLEFTQGNAIKPEQVKALRPGMPKAEVRALLGLPVLQDPFHNQRWDYIFRYLPGKAEARQSRLTLYFDNDVLREIDDSDYIDPDTILPPPTIEHD